MTLPIAGLYLVTDTRIQQRFGHLDLIRAAIAGGVDVIQLRDKVLSMAALLPVAREAGEMCRRAGVTFIVNDRLDLALAAGADGVHLGRHDLPLAAARRLAGDRLLIGGTASTVDEAVAAARTGADYVGFGHVFATTTKEKDYPPRGIEALRTVCRAVDRPVIAIGGIGPDQVEDVMAAGATGVAVSAAVCRADDPETATQVLVRRLRAAAMG